MWMESEMLPPLLPTASIACTHPQAPAVGKPSPCQSLLGPQSAEKTLRNKFTYQEIPHELSPGATRLEVLAATHAEHRAGGSHAAPWQGERGKRGWERDEHQPQSRCFCPEFCAGSFSTRQPQGHRNYEAGPKAVNPSGKKQNKNKTHFSISFLGSCEPLRAQGC